MKYLIFNSEKEAIAFNEKMNAKLSYLWTDGITNNYANPIKHPTKDLWAICVDGKHEQHFLQADKQKGEDLGKDWEYIKKFKDEKAK